MDDAGAIDVDNGSRSHPDHPGRAIAALANRQGGVVARRQVRAMVLSSNAIDRLVHSGRLIPLRPGVYAVGHRALPRGATRWAAVLAAGNDAFLSHRAAATAWSFPVAATDIDVTSPRRLRSRPGLRVHRARIAPDERTTLDGLPTTTPSRTLLDLAAVLDRRGLERALERAELARRVDLRAVNVLLDRYPRRAGAPALGALIAAGVRDERLTRSEREEAFLAFVDARRLPRPRPPQGPAPPARRVAGRPRHAAAPARRARPRRRPAEPPPGVVTPRRPPQPPSRIPIRPPMPPR